MANITFTSDGGITASGTITAPTFSGSLSGNASSATISTEFSCDAGTSNEARFVYYAWAGEEYNPSSGIPVKGRAVVSHSFKFNPATGILTAPSFSATSSRKKKRNIEDCDLNATELLKNVKIVNYVLKNDETETPRIGFIAEDTDPLLSTPDQEHIDITNTLGVLIKAVQELNEKIDKLEKENKELKEKING